MKEETKPTRAQLEKDREQLWYNTGRHQFTKAVIEAELIQWNQKLLDINNQISQMPKETPPPALVPEVVDDVQTQT